MNEKQRIPVVALTLNKSVKNFNEFDVSFKVRERGWVLSAYAMPPDAQDIINACKYLKKYEGTATPPQLHSPHQLAHKC
jgi:glutamate decarboxylase